MAERVNSTYSADPKPSIKRKAISADAPPLPKRTVRRSPSNVDEFEDTATSKKEKELQDDIVMWEDHLDYTTSELKKEDEDTKEVELLDIVVLKDLLDYRKLNGVFPFASKDHMQKFCCTWIRMGFGNLGGWNAKIKDLKDKYKNHIGPIQPEQKAEYIMWNMVFGNEGSGSNDDNQPPV